MDYGKAEGIRKKGLAGLITENLVEGQGIGSSFGSAISDRTKATFTGIQEKFDPLNIAKKITGGSNLAPALFGRLTGRKQSSIEYFAKPKRKVSSKGVNFETGGSLNNDSFTETLGLIYEELKLAEEDRKIINQSKKTEEQNREKEEDRRNKSIVEALTARRKPEETPKEKAKKKKKETEKKGKDKKEEQVTEKKDTKTKTETKKKQEETKKETTKKETTDKKKETAQKVEEKKVEPKPKVEKAPEAPKPEVKAPSKVTPKEAPKVPSVSTAAKAAAGAAIVGGLLMPNETVAKDIDRASKEVGVDKSLMYAMAKQESGFNPNAAAKTSSAKGLYQFIKGTWEGMVKKYGSKYPILQEKGPEDSYANALAGALFIKENSDFLAKSNIPINATTIYAAHFLGPGGARKLLTADPNANAAELMPQAANANDFIFYNKTNGKLDKSKPRTVQEVIDALFQKVGQFQEKYATALAQINSGGNIDNASKENKDLKRTTSDKNAVIVNTTNINQTSNAPQTRKQEKENDRPAILEKSRG
jgi:soluble lytic murein transglycosylase-like protein